MDEILKIVLDYGLTGGALVVMSYALILMVKYQEKRDTQFMEILGRMDVRLATIEEQNRQDSRIKEEMITATQYCLNHNKRK